MKPFEIKIDDPLAKMFLDAFEKTIISLGFQKGEEVRNPDAPDLLEYVQDNFRILVTVEQEADHHKISISSRDGDVIPFIEKSVKTLLTHVINVFVAKGLKEIENIRECLNA